MADDKQTKIPITDRECLWVKNIDKGDVSLYVGPTLFQPSAADCVVCDDGNGGYADDPSATPQRMVEVSDGQYAVIFNPVADPEGQPNGAFAKGINETAKLINGTKTMVPGPCSFYLRPGQRCEVRDAHRLEAHEYVVVEVQGTVDQASPYYNITARSVKSSGVSLPLAEDSEERTLRLGSRVVITGLDTNFYIPPSGLDLVPDTSVDASGKEMTPDVAQRLISNRAMANTQEEALVANYLDQFAPESKGVTRRAVPASVEQSSRLRHAFTEEASYSSAMGFDDDEIAQSRRQDEMRRNLDHAMAHNKAFQEAVQKEARKAALVRRAVVLSEKEFCVLIDADGKRQVHQGPARVFPGPYDRFQTTGSRNRVYDAYELLPQRAVWLRVITEVSSETLAKKLPHGIELKKEVYYPGDELLVHGVSAFFFPFNEIEVLNAQGAAVVGNDHSSVLIEEIGIDQKSGIYVRDLRTGEARLIRGKQSYLVDPRKEVQILRLVSPGDWNLMIGEQEPHKHSNTEVRTPWALSITIPHNMAVLATSAEGQRVIEGPKVELLEYEERLAVLKLSRGRPKGNKGSIETCFLRVRGNRVSDEVEIETRDFVRIRMILSYTITFRQEHKDEWFNHLNYVKLLVNQLRSMLRGQLRKVDFLELQPQIEDLVRDTVLGGKVEGEAREGRLFDTENGMHVHAVDVLEIEIMNKDIAQQLIQVQTSSVSLRIGDREAKDQLASAQLRATLADDQRQIDAEQFQLDAGHERKKAQLIHEHELSALAEQWRTRAQHEAEAHRDALEDLQAALHRDNITHKAELAQSAEVVAGEVEAAQLRHAEEQTHAQATTALEVELIAAQSAATVAERQAVTPGLVEALSGWSESHIMSTAASNMGLVSLFKGKDVATLLEEFLGSSKVAKVVQRLRSGPPKTTPL
jgi:hypothetical protein